MAGKFEIGDRVRMPDDYVFEKVRGEAGMIVGIEFEGAYLVRLDGAYPVASSLYASGRDDGWSVWDESGTRLTLLDASDDVREDEESTDDAPKRFNVGDRVEIIGGSRESLLAFGDEDDDDAHIFAFVHGFEGDDVNVLPEEKRFEADFDDGTWLVRLNDLRPASPEATPNDERPRGFAVCSSSRSKKIDKTAINVGDRVEIVGTPRDSLLSTADVGDDSARIVGEVIEVNGDIATVRPDDEAFQNDIDEDRSWFVRFDDLRLEATPAVKPRRSSSRSKKVTSDTQPPDPKRINVVQVDISKAIVGDDFPARSKSDEFEAILLALIAEGVDPSQVYFTNGLETTK